MIQVLWLCIQELNSQSTFFVPPAPEVPEPPRFLGESCSHTNVSKRPVLHQAIERDDLRENKAAQGVRIDASRMRMWILHIGFSLWICAGVRSCIHVRIIVIDAQHTGTTHFATYVKGHRYHTVHFRLIISRDHRNVGEHTPCSGWLAWRTCHNLCDFDKYDDLPVWFLYTNNLSEVCNSQQAKMMRPPA